MLSNSFRTFCLLTFCWLFVASLSQLRHAPVRTLYSHKKTEKLTAKHHKVISCHKNTIIHKLIKLTIINGYTGAIQFTLL